MAEKYIGMFDLLGFKDLIERNSLQTVVNSAQRLVRTARGVKLIPGKVCAGRLTVLVFQDTIVVTTAGVADSDFRCITEYACALIGFGFVDGFVLRGSIVRGEAHVDNDMVIGKGLIKAYQMEQSQQWMGCWVDDDCVASVSSEVRDELESWLLLRYFVPLKSGPMRETWALNWTVPFGAIQHTSLRKAWDRVWTPACEDSRVSWDARHKLEQTDRFLSTLLRKGWLPKDPSPDRSRPAV